MNLIHILGSLTRRSTAVEQKSESSLEEKSDLVQPQLHRVIIEGGFQDDWKNHTVDRINHFIPYEVTSIKISTYDYTLIAREEEYGLTQVECEFQEKEALKLNYSIFRGIQRPRSIIVEDGRVFYDKKIDPRHLESYINVITDIFSN